nr:SsrA-binding protein [Croceivirga thetidis]
MEKSIYRTLAKLNKIVLPSMTKRRLDLAKAKKWQLALIGYRAFVTKKALG